MGLRKALLPAAVAGALALHLLMAGRVAGQGPTPTPTPPRPTPPVPSPGITVIRYNTPTPPPSPTPSPTPTPTPSPAPTSTRTPSQPAVPTPQSVGRLRGRFRADEPGRVLAVPLRSQLDGTAYAEANCGPASLAMVLEAYGLRPTIPELRALANRLQGTTSPDIGVWPEVLAQVAAAYGLQVTGPRPFWTAEEVRAALDRREPVITVVQYRALPSNGASIATTDHYIVLTGYQGDRFFYNDPAFADEAGFGRIITEAQLKRAWAGAAAPGIVLAVGPGPGFEAVPDLLTARLPVPPDPAPVGAPSRPPEPALAAEATPSALSWYAFLVPVPAGLTYAAAVLWLGRRLGRKSR